MVAGSKTCLLSTQGLGVLAFDTIHALYLASLATAEKGKCMLSSSSPLRFDETFDLQNVYLSWLWVYWQLLLHFIYVSE